MKKITNPKYKSGQVVLRKYTKEVVSEEHNIHCFNSGLFSRKVELSCKWPKKHYKYDETEHAESVKLMGVRFEEGEWMYSYKSMKHEGFSSIYYREIKESDILQAIDVEVE